MNLWDPKLFSGMIQGIPGRFSLEVRGNFRRPQFLGGMCHIYIFFPGEKKRGCILDRSIPYLQVHPWSAKTQHLSVYLRFVLEKDERLFQSLLGVLFSDLTSCVCLHCWLISFLHCTWNLSEHAGFWSTFVIRLSHSCCNSCFSNGTATFSDVQWPICWICFNKNHRTEPGSG